MPSTYATAQRHAFDTNAGYAGSDISVGMTYKNKSIWTGGFVRYHSLAGTQLADSPLVFKQDNWSVGFGVVWVFYSKSKS
ncbi:MAG: MipA/OmpV family protein [Gammaproteobacteria bacterium]|nr:MipA/OmpV family protein [Gammaproteobacteria bacterium]